MSRLSCLILLAPAVAAGHIRFVRCLWLQRRPTGAKMPRRQELEALDGAQRVGADGRGLSRLLWSEDARKNFPSALHLAGPRHR